LTNVISSLNSSYKVIDVENGQQAINICETNDIDLIFTDLCMPIKNGYDVLTFIIEDKDLKHIPVIIVSSD